MTLPKMRSQAHTGTVDGLIALDAMSVQTARSAWSAEGRLTLAGLALSTPFFSDRR